MVESKNFSCLKQSTMYISTYMARTIKSIFIKVINLKFKYHPYLHSQLKWIVRGLVSKRKRNLKCIISCNNNLKCIRVAAVTQVFTTGCVYLPSSYSPFNSFGLWSLAAICGEVDDWIGFKRNCSHSQRFEFTAIATKWFKSDNPLNSTTKKHS